MHPEDYWVGTYCQKPKSAANIRLNWTSCAQAQVPIRPTGSGCWSWHRNNPEDIKLCMWKRHYAPAQGCNKHSCKSSCHQPSSYRRLSRSGKVWNLVFNAAVTHHVNIILVWNSSKIPRIFLKLHSELWWLLPSNESTNSLHSWILTLHELQRKWAHRLACSMHSWLLASSQ